MISAVFSLFSGGLRGGSVCSWKVQSVSMTRDVDLFVTIWRTHQHEVVILWLASQIFENALLPKPLHVVPVLDETMLDGVVYVVRL